MSPCWRTLPPLLLATAVVLAACAPAAPAPGSAAAPPTAPLSAGPAALPPTAPQASAPPLAARTKVRIAYPSRNPTTGLIAVEKEAGFFDQYGVDAELHQINSPLSTTAMISGEVDFNQLGAEPIMSARLHGADTVLLSCGTRMAFWWVVGKPSIQRPQDLKGLRVANSRQGSNLYEVFQLALGKWSLNADDVTLVTVDGDPQKLLALHNDAADATVVNPTSFPRAAELGFRAIADLGELDIEWPSSCVSTTQRFMADQPAAARGVVQAYVAAAQWMKTHRPEAVEILTAFTGSDDRAAAEVGYDTYLKYMADVPYPSRSGLQTILTTIFSDAAGTAAPEQFVDDRILRDLEASGFIGSVVQR
jgi:ABC-type nitrate/sulfonate/bicarbonate transport system substrate-binding protein